MPMAFVILQLNKSRNILFFTRGSEEDGDCEDG